MTMLANSGQACKIVKLIDPASAANTAEATSGWVDVRESIGDLLISVSMGALTGSITWTVEDATSGAGAGAAAVTPEDGAFAAGVANSSQRRNVNSSRVRGWIRVVGTIVTGPVLVSANVMFHPKYTV